MRYRLLPMTSMLLVAMSAWVAVAVQSAENGPIDFARDIRPILSDACFACHGPDSAHRQADLRLDRPGSSAIVAGNAEASELVARLTSDDPDVVMPPPHVGKPLSEQTIELFRRWIEQGGEYVDHWAFTPPTKSPVPKIDPSVLELKKWPRGPIDSFVLDRLMQAGMTPAPPADRPTLLRRLHLDLTGLPPTAADFQRFTSDTMPLAYEREVHRLLDSVHYGERWGRVWLDAARYADSDGFEKDKPRSVWFYRDWVIRALNDDLPYNEFVIKQIAGDLLPNATQDDHVATGFLRNSMVNEEGGVDPEQFRMEAMFDRMDAIGKSILGLTLQCARCHSHKYDPISQSDYFGLFAFINDCDEACITVFTPTEEKERAATVTRIGSLISDRLAKDDDWLSRWAKWEVNATQAKTSAWTPVEIAFIAETIGGQKFLRQDDASYLAAGYAPTKFHPTGDVVVDSINRVTALRIEMLTDPNLPHSGPGRSVDGTWALSEVELSVAKTDTSGNEIWEKVAWEKATATIDLPQSTLGDQYFDKSKTQRLLGPAHFAIDGDANTAWHGNVGPGRRNEPHTALLVLAQPIEATMGDDSSDNAALQPIRMRIKLSQNHGGWNSDDNQTHNLGRFRISVTADPQPAIQPLPPSVMQTIAKKIENRNELEMMHAFEHFIRQDHLLKDIAGELDKAWQNYPTGTSQLVLAQRQTPRQTHLLQRGDFLSPQEVITPTIASLLNPIADNTVSSESAADPVETSRLDFAKWLGSSTNPTTARSIVNRIWQEYFGTGLTATTDDLGMQGEPPSHRELLDFLAVDLIENGWSLKALHRQIVLSSTYRQDAHVSPQLLMLDPQNRLLARGPRMRVSAEMIRDIALTASGLLNKDVGGPPVFPPAPEFLFLPPASYGPKTWATSEAGQRYRRSLYTFSFRSVPYPVLQAFDAPNGDVACVRRTISNTPLQALVTLNEPMFLQCARALAKMAVSQVEQTDDAAAIDFIFIASTSRKPTDAERAVLVDLINAQRARFQAEGDIAKQLALDDSASAAELAAWTVVCRVVLNLDETISKP